MFSRFETIMHCTYMNTYILLWQRISLECKADAIRCDIEFFDCMLLGYLRYQLCPGLHVRRTILQGFSTAESFSSRSTAWAWRRLFHGYVVKLLHIYLIGPIIFTPGDTEGIYQSAQAVNKRQLTSARGLRKYDASRPKPSLLQMALECSTDQSLVQ